MNRRLHTQIIACTTLALALSAGLLLPSPDAMAGAAVMPAEVEADKAPARIERVATEASGAATEAPRPRTRRARSGFALPYFSFARGAGGRS